jgi:hypothetical protein
MRGSSFFATALAALALVAEATPKLDAPTTGRIRTAIDVALTPVRFSQSRTDGSYGDETTTALVLRAFMESHRRYNEEDGPFITRAVDFLGRSPDGPEHWVVREALFHSSKKSDPARWPSELVSELGPSPRIRDPRSLAFAVEAIQSSGAPLDGTFWEEAVRAASSGESSAAADYVRTLAALGALGMKTGSFDRPALARSITSRCASIRTVPEPYHHYYFLAATLRALARDPESNRDLPAGCSAELAELLLSRQQFEGFWPASEDEAEGDKLRTTALAILTLVALGEI